jgi:hypothetical protein
LVALPWDELDGLDDEDLWWASLAAEPPSGSMSGLLELAADFRPAWHAQAACRDRSDLDWFAAADQTATEAVCATCPAVGPCGDAGRREAFGVWGGQAHRMTVRPCVDCGEAGVYSLGRCQRCYKAHWRRAQGIPEKPKGRRVGVCVECGQERQMQGRDGQCRWCYTRAVYYRQKAERAQAG